MDIYARLYNSNGAPAAAGEFLVNSNSFPCANPTLAAGKDGGFLVAWSQRDMVVVTNGWDVYARAYACSNNLAAGARFSGSTLINMAINMPPGSAPSVWII